MRKALVTWLLSAAVVLTPVAAARAETSIACMYMLIRVYHAELDACRVPLSNDREARYQRVRGSLEQFIRTHAKNDPEKIISGIENDNIKRALAGLKSCKSDDFKFAAQALATGATTTAAANNHGIKAFRMHASSDSLI